MILKDERSRKHGSFKSLVNIMAKLRGPGGCPWDREQTHESLLPYLQEEAFEVLDAVRSKSPAKICEELGDLLLQIVFHAQVARDNGEFDIDDVVASIAEKLIRRHPHVFGRKKLDTPAEVLEQWEKIKSHERGESSHTSLMTGVPREAPALQQADIIQRRAARVGFDWKDIEGPLDKVYEEIQEIHHAARSKERAQVEEEVGDLLFALVNVCRFLDVSPEAALRGTNRKFVGRFGSLERTARARGLDLGAMTLEEMDVLWEEAKTEKGGECAP